MIPFKTNAFFDMDCAFTRPRYIYIYSVSGLYIGGLERNRGGGGGGGEKSMALMKVYVFFILWLFSRKIYYGL